MEQPNVEDIKVEPSTNDAGQHQEDDNKRDMHGGGGFGGRGRGGRGRGGGERRGFDNRRGGGGGGRWGQGRGGGMGGDRGDRGDRQDNRNNDDQDGEGNRDGGGNREGGGMRDGGNRGPRGGGRFGMRGPDDKFSERMQQIMGPTFDLPPIVMTEKKFNGRNRLYIGNIGNEVTEEDLIEIFKPYGETTERFLNKEKNFAFVKLDYHSNAEKAKRELDGSVLKSRNLKIRFAPNSATVKVKNLTPYVTNELLHYAFSVFGEIERCVVCVDERGRPTGEATIDFARKGSALHAIRKCSDGCFFLTTSLRPCIVEAHEYVDDIDGYSDKNIIKKTHDFHREREVGPRFASPGSFEHEYGMRWKQLYDLSAQKQESLKKELELEKEKLEAQMEYARYEHETEMLRDQLRAREMDKERQKREWEMKQRQVEEERLRSEEMMRRKQEELETRITQQKEDMRRRQQENNLFMQAHNLDTLMEEQEQAYDQPAGYGGGTTGSGNVDDNGTMLQENFQDYNDDLELYTIEEEMSNCYLNEEDFHPETFSTPLEQDSGEISRAARSPIVAESQAQEAQIVQPFASEELQALASKEYLIAGSELNAEAPSFHGRLPQLEENILPMEPNPIGVVNTFQLRIAEPMTPLPMIRHVQAIIPACNGIRQIMPPLKAPIVFPTYMHYNGWPRTTINGIALFLIQFSSFIT